MKRKGASPVIHFPDTAFTALLASAVEVFPRETNGMILGDIKRGGKLYSVDCVLPYQTGNKTKESTGHCIKRRSDSIGVFIGHRYGYIGEFHSHTFEAEKMDVRISKDDIENARYRVREYPIGKQVDIEVLVSLRPIKIRVSELTLKQGKKCVHGRFPVLTDEKKGFAYNISAWLITQFDTTSMKVTVKLI